MGGKVCISTWVAVVVATQLLGAVHSLYPLFLGLAAPMAAWVDLQPIVSGIYTWELST